MRNLVKKIKYDYETKQFCIYYQAVKVYVQEEYFSTELLKRIVIFVDSCNAEKPTEEIIYKAFKVGEEICFEKMKREMIE